MNTRTNREHRLLVTAWLMRCVPLLLLLLAPARATATYVDRSNNYMVTPAGAGEIKFKMPVYDKDGDDCWVYEGTLYYQEDGDETLKEVFHIFIGDDDKWGDIPDGRPTLQCDVTNMGGGTITIDPVVNGIDDRDPTASRWARRRCTAACTIRATSSTSTACGRCPSRYAARPSPSFGT